MFGGGWTEMLIIGIVALVVIGPKDLPVVMRRVGRVVGTIRRMGSEFQQELNKTTGLDQITDLRRQITEPLRQTSDEIMREFNKVTTTGVEPSGVIKPADGKTESVYDEIVARSQPTDPAAVAAPVMTSTSPTSPATATQPLPAPPEAAVAVEPEAKPARVRKARKTASAAVAEVLATDATGIVTAPAPKSVRRSATASSADASAPAASPAEKPVRRRVAVVPADVDPVKAEAAAEASVVKPRRRRAGRG